MKSNIIRIKEDIEAHNIVISKIKDYINLRNLKPGDKLPSERLLSEQLNVSRRVVGEVIQKLELYQLVKSVPKSGTFITDIGLIAMNGIIDDIMTIKKQDFLSLVETRLMLEEKSVYLAAKRRTDKDLKNIESTFNKYKAKILSGKDALQEDMLFHLAIAKASKNSTINTLMLQIVPNIISTFEKTRVCDEDGFKYEAKMHEAILNAIRNKKPEQAVTEMKAHFKLLIEFCNDFKHEDE